MAVTEKKLNECMKRLMLSRMRIINSNGFYGLLLMHMIYTLDESCETAATDGRKIFFCPSFLDTLNDAELDFVLMHEILHVALRHCIRNENRDDKLFNIACDIVVNSNILLSNNNDLKVISLRSCGVLMHTAPDGKEGCEYTAEQVYAMLIKKQNGNHSSLTRAAKSGNKKQNSKSGALGQERSTENWDDHARWGAFDHDGLYKDIWNKRIIDACAAIRVRDPSNQRGLLPAFATRLADELLSTKTDWRTILNNFIQEEIVDYSFAPPDRRFNESPFFLPEFNYKEDVIEDILFMIDTSGSISDKMLSVAYSEVRSAIDQFDGRLKGWLGFFDAEVTEPKQLQSETELQAIKPVGGGGTNFEVIFAYVHTQMAEKLPAAIIILTDGFAPFPDESLSLGIPVLWLINNDSVMPPWGKVARIGE